VSDPGWRAWASEHRIDLVLFAFSLFAYALSSGSLSNKPRSMSV